MELLDLRQHQEKVVECIDNDETASEIAALMKSKYLVILTSSVGLLEDQQDNNSLIIGHSKYRIKDLIVGNVERTIFRVK